MYFVMEVTRPINKQVQMLLFIFVPKSATEITSNGIIINDFTLNERYKRNLI